MPDRSADLSRLLTTHAADLEGVVRRFADDPMDRDDLRQEIAVALWKAMPSFRGESSERTWVARIAHNRGVSFRVRQARRDARLLPLPDELPALGGSHTGEHEAARLTSRLADAMALLPAPQREALTLAATGWTPAQIAADTGRTPGAVRVTLHRARAAVRAMLGLPKGDA
jgi:RNA polymerase sigma factor (sigma-70 family)